MTKILPDANTEWVADTKFNPPDPGPTLTAGTFCLCLPSAFRYTQQMRVNLTAKAIAEPVDQGSTGQGASARNEIDSPERLETFLRDFYRDVAQDDIIGPLFTDVAQVDWTSHIPKIASFWNRFLFGITGYTGNPMSAHTKIHAQHAFTPRHFERWLSLFNQTLDDRWYGTNVDRMKKLATNVAAVHAKHLGVEVPHA